MASITLELIVDGTEEVTLLPLYLYVHKRIERFIYSDKLKTSAAPIAYLESRPLDSWENVRITNRTYGLPTNSPRMASRRLGWAEIRAASYSSEYKNILATHVSATDEANSYRPMFYKHILEQDTSEVNLYSVESGNTVDVDGGFVSDLESFNLYTNYGNYFNPTTGDYKLYFVTSTNEDGTTVQELLNPVPVVGEATWKDIDLDTGALIEGREVYSKEETSTGYTFYFNGAKTFWIRPGDHALIQPLLPSSRSPEMPWYMRFTNGNFTAYANETVRRYWMPEYDRQPFFPSKPYVYSTYGKLTWVNNNVVATSRKKIAINPEENLHITVRASNPDGEIVKVFTTDSSLEGVRFSDTDVFYETDKIKSWDNQGGFVVFGVQILPSWELDASFYYEADDFEYTSLSLNPIEDINILRNTYVFYLVPDVDEDDTALHHLVVGPNGRILYCSQAEGVVVPNLQLRNADTTYNTDTVVGMTYFSEVDTDTFLDLYTVGYDNEYAYYVLAEVSLAETSTPEDIVDIDLQRQGAVVTANSFTDAIRSNPKILQSALGYGEEGQEVPENGVMVINAPLTLLEGYGGTLSESEAERLLRLRTSATGYAVIRWDYPQSQLTGSSLTSTDVELEWTWEGPNQTYRLYRRDSSLEEWELIDTQVDPAEATLSYTGVAASGSVLQYAVTIEEDGVEFPFGNTLTIEVM